MLRRFYSERPVASDTVTIDGDEAQHILNVNRMVVGDELMLFDGSGKEFRAKINFAEKKRLDVEILEALDISRESPVNLTLAVALPKGDRQKMLVEKLVEVGVSRLIPLHCQRSVAKANPKATERLRRRVIEASKQCGRNLLMQIDEAQAFGELVGGFDTSCTRLIAHPHDCKPLHECEIQHATRPAIVAIGPEGGFANHEVKLATDAGWQPVSFAPSVMRVETAALVAAALIGMKG